MFLAIVYNKILNVLRIWLQYNVAFYLQYLARWPEYCMIAEANNLQRIGYSTFDMCSILMVDFHFGVV